MKLEDWPNCPTPDCENKICLWANTGLCYKCSVMCFGKAAMDYRYEETHTEGKLNPEIEGIEDE